MPHPSRRVVHRDLKPENVLMDENHVVKIADFGLAAITAPFNEGLTLMCGTPEFTAPEIVAGKEYDGASVDIWSLGVMLFEFVSGYLPFQAKEQKELFRMISKGQRAQLPGDVSLDVEDLINSMMQIKVTLPSTHANTHTCAPFIPHGYATALAWLASMPFRIAGVQIAAPTICVLVSLQASSPIADYGVNC